MKFLEGLRKSGKKDLTAEKKSAYFKQNRKKNYGINVDSSDCIGPIDIDNNKVSELYVYTKKWSHDRPYKRYGYVSGKMKLLISYVDQ